MHTRSYHLLERTKVLSSLIVLLFTILLTSCSEDETTKEIINPHEREGIIKFYTDKGNIVFSKILEYPFVKFSENKMDYDTIGVAYTGYTDESHSIIGSIQMIVLYDNLQLNYVEYRYPLSDMVAISFARWDAETDQDNPLEYNIYEQEDDVVIGEFKGNLYPGGSNDENPIVVDSCFFCIHKKPLSSYNKNSR